MATKLKITGVIDRSEPDPAAPLNLSSRWIGSVSVAWTIDGRPHAASAAILRYDTGGGWRVEKWGAHHLALRWHGDEPAAEISGAVYEVLLHRGPVRGAFQLDVEACSRIAPDAPAYYPFRGPAALTPTVR